MRRISLFFCWFVVLYALAVIAIQLLSMFYVDTGFRVYLNERLTPSGCQVYAWNKKGANPLDVADFLWNHDYWLADYRVHRTIFQSDNCVSQMANFLTLSLHRGPITIVAVNDDGDVVMKLKKKREAR